MDIQTHRHIYIHAHTYVHTYTCTHIHTHVCTHTHARTHTHTHTHSLPLMVKDFQLHGWAQPQDGGGDDVDGEMGSPVMNHWSSPVMSSHH